MEEEKTHTIRLVEDPWATVRHIIEAAALIAAGVWAFYTFIYQEKIKPAGDPAVMVETISVQRIGQDRTRDILEVSVNWHNTGKTEIEVAADGFNMWGDRYAHAVSHTYQSAGNKYILANDDPLVSHQLIRAYGELRDTAIGGLHGVHTTIAPDNIITVQYTVVIPRGKYDVIQAQVLIVPVKTPVRPRPSVQIVRGPDGSIVLRSPTPGVYQNDNRFYFGLLPD